MGSFDAWRRVLLVAGAVAAVGAVCSGPYGPNPCRFVPAPPGQTPACARPGLTYCEHPDHYPGQLIYHLVKKWHLDHETLLRDESKEDFAAYFTPTPKPLYGPPPRYGAPSNGGYGGRESQTDGYQPEPIYIPKPDFPANYREPALSYIPPKLDTARNFSFGFNGYPSGAPKSYYDPAAQFYNYKYTNNIPQEPAYQPPQYDYNPQSYYQSTPVHPQGNYYPNLNEIWKGSERLKRSPKHGSAESDKVSQLQTNGTDSHLRNKRQAGDDTPQLCRVRSQFIMPRAALNNQGNWMYIVNMPEMNERYTQLVKSETCIDTTCNGLCSVPDGYTSRCEQKYVQKRLVALDGGGSNLYSEIFWFPSCCVCTIVRN